VFKEKAKQSWIKFIMFQIVLKPLFIALSSPCSPQNQENIFQKKNVEKKFDSNLYNSFVTNS